MKLIDLEIPVTPPSRAALDVATVKCQLDRLFRPFSDDGSGVGRAHR
jgi:hypothetical protein